jgi:two-component system NtrC family sensor kinase
MRKRLLLVLLALYHLPSSGQIQQIKKLRQQISEHKQADTFRVNRLVDLSVIAPLTVEQRDSNATESLAISRKLNYQEGIVYSLLNLSVVASQRNDRAGSMKLKEQALAIAETLKDKTALVNVYSSIANLKYNTGEGKSALAFSLKAYGIAQSLQDKVLMSRCEAVIASTYSNSIGDYAKAMDWALRAEKSAEEANNLGLQAQAWSNLAAIYLPMGDITKSLFYYKKALDANKKLGNIFLEFNLLNRIGEMYRLTGNYPEALKAYTEGLTATQAPYNTELTQSNIADVYVRLGKLPMAFKYAFISLNTAKQINDTEGEEWIDGILARAYLKKNMPDSSLFYALNGYDKATHTGTLEFKRDNCEALGNAYAAKKDFENAYKYRNLFVTYRDSMTNAEVANHANVLQYNYDLAKKQAQIIALNQDKKAQRYFLTGAFILIGLIIITVIVLLRNNRQKQKAFELLSKQKIIIEDQRDQTNKALADLQLTQRQLVQSEKMASLGELTAGIAHEIQNPLNFVNNFSEVNIELIDEIENELTNGDKSEAIGILVDVRQNLEKIRHHGKRADGIVKGMLQHSRASSNIMEPTNINTLADEYLRLAYHGLRAKDKSFNAELVTGFEDNLPLINIVPQDIGRVLLNLYTNAFYATQQKQKTAEPGYKPTLTVNTSSHDGFIKIRVKDNGNGIPEDIREKIMQPFFTTKPTGEGTGLGLSLSYDIVVKGHGGKIDVSSKNEGFTEFIITLPL